MTAAQSLYRRSTLTLAAMLALSACSAPPASDARPPVGVEAPPPSTPAEAAPPPEPVMREGFVVGDPVAEGIDGSALGKLAVKAKAQGSEALIVVKNGKLVFEDYFGAADEPIFAMSASKSFTALAYGFLLADGKLASLDERVSKTLPGFGSDAWKAKMTFRHLLSQTAGLDPTRAGGPKGDIEAHALSVSCKFEPGTSWQYSNNGVDLLAALAGRLAGKPMDEYLNEKLFRPMGIADVAWMRDKRGVPLGAGEMFIRPLDMAKVGQALLAGGVWQGKSVVPAAWPALSFAQSSAVEPLYGLLWWRDARVTAVGLTADVLAQWTTAGLAPAVAAQLEPLVGRSFSSEKLLYSAIQNALSGEDFLALDTLLQSADHLPTARHLAVDTVKSFYAAGWLGQFLVVVPEKKLVAVRMRRARDADYGAGPEVDGFPTFTREVPALVK